MVGLCARAAVREIHPVTSVHDCAMIPVHQTSRASMRGFVDRVPTFEGRDGAVSISLAHGFPWGDVPGMGTRVLVIADDRTDRGDALARQLGEEMVAFRFALLLAHPDAAIDAALVTEGTPVVLADSAYDPGDGASGGSTFVLRRLVVRVPRSAALSPL